MIDELEKLKTCSLLPLPRVQHNKLACALETISSTVE